MTERKFEWSIKILQHRLAALRYYGENLTLLPSEITEMADIQKAITLLSQSAPEPPSVSREEIERALADVRSYEGDGPVGRLIAYLAAAGIRVEGEEPK